MAARSVFTVLEETAREQRHAAALHQPIGGKANNDYRTYSWNDWLTISREIALGLRTLGAQKGEIVCILSETRAEFYLVDLGIMGAGAVAAALYTAYPTPDLARNIRDAQPRFLFVENAKTFLALRRTIEDLGERLPERVIVMTGEAEGAMPLDELQRIGRDAMTHDPSAFLRIQEELSPEDPAIFYLTSGATGEPKMGLTSHRAILANIDMAPVALPIGPDDSIVVFLPSAHIAQRIVLELVPMRMGTPVWFSESLARLPNELAYIRPTVLLAPPRVWEKMYAGIQRELKKRPRFAKELFHRALKLGGCAATYKRAGKRLPLWLASLLNIADKAIFTSIRARLGGRIRIAASGAAPLGKNLAEFFEAIGMPIVEGYGLTEAGVISLNPLERPKPGSVGKLLPGVEARLAADGELQVRTPCIFNGYYRDEAATQSVLSTDNWFLTGDIAEMDDDGYWYITGRKKELIVSSSGKKIYPTRIENLFKTEPIVNQVLLIGDKKPYVTALLTLNLAQVETLDEIKKQQPNSVIHSELASKAVQEAVSRVNQHLADFERIRRFKVLDRDFSIDHGELTPTMKIRRTRVLDNHRDLVSQLYLGREENE